MSEAHLTDAELRQVRAILRAFSGPEWKALKALAGGLVAAMGNGGGAPSTSNGGGSSSPGGGSSSGDRGELPDSFLDSQSWTDKTINKDPNRWAGQPMVGFRYSEAPSDWHDCMADQLEWKAQKGREEVPVRMQERGKNAGKPWHEADSFAAKICRAWSRRNKGKALPPAVPASGRAPDGGGSNAGDEAYDPGANAPVGDDGIPF